MFHPNPAPSPGRTAGSARFIRSPSRSSGNYMSKPQAITDFAPDSFAAMFEESLKSSEMRSGEVITAEVVRIDHSFVVVNAGLKSEAYVPIDEFKNDQGEVEVQIGDF